jgi:hypothetical protein
MINKLDETYEKSGGAVGMTSTASNWRVDPGPRGAVIVWTNTNHEKFITPSGQPISGDVYKLNTQGSWGTYLILAPVNVPSPGRMAKLCELDLNVRATFPNAALATNP